MTSRNPGLTVKNMLVAKVKKTRHFERSSKGARVQGRGQNLKDLFVFGYLCFLIIIIPDICHVWNVTALVKPV